MRRRWWIVVVAPVAIAAFIFIGGEVVMHLWNWLVPALFGWRQITFWQAIGLLVLCRILFGNIGGHGPGRHMRSRMAQNMTEEERERMRQRMRARCGFGEPPSETKQPAQS